MDLVRLRGKPVLVFVIVLAVLYVFISPLPEMAATKSCPHLAFLAASLLCMLFLIFDPLSPHVSGQLSVAGHGLRRSLLCVRLC